MFRLPLTAALLVFLSAAAVRSQELLIKPGERILFLGDSNTQAGGYIAYLDGYLYSRFPGKKFELINLGLGSETCCGLTEEDHPFPRPNVHDRIDRALSMVKPDVVSICYGMNDGIYHPFGEERFAKFQKGLLSAAEKAKKAGARVILMSSAPFDPLPVAKRVQPATGSDFGYKKPFDGYDGVLKKQAEWIMSLKDSGYTLVDGHSAVHRHLAEMRKKDPKYFVSGDGIHPNAAGHLAMANEILKAWNAKDSLTKDEIDANAGWWKLVQDRQRILGPAWLSHIGHTRPGIGKGMPLDEAKTKAKAIEDKIVAK